MRLADGRRAFVKAVGSELNPDSPDLHRAEARALAMLPAGVPAPRLLATYDDGDWVALALEDVEGRRPTVPWTTVDVDAVASSLSRIAGTTAHSQLRPFADVVKALSAWDDVAVEPDGLDPGLTARLPEMLDHQARAREVTRGDALVHWDARSANILIRPDGEAVLVDWAWACRGATWLDTLLLAVDFVVQGGPDPDDFLRSAAATRDVPGAHLQSVVACMVGVWSDRARRPAPPGLPTIRAWQGHCARGALRWLDEGTIWD